MGRLDRRLTEREERTDEVIHETRRYARPLVTDRDLDPLIERIGSSRYVLLGEATHGTSEFYTWRARLSRRLILEKGFHFIAVEGDWPDCYRVNRYVKHRHDAGKSARRVLHAFERWPTWMWANREIEQLAEWLRAHNEHLPEDARAGFYGLDVYSLWDSIKAVVDYLDRVDPVAAKHARRAYECFAPYNEDEQAYARATALVPTSCEREVSNALAELRMRAPFYREDGREAYFNAEQNALTAKNAELYYRTMVRGGAASWNVRDMHMVETLDRLMEFHGPNAKAIVWEHNTHVGDARATDMIDEGELNVGQLVRERHERDGVVLVGFSTHRGSVIAGDEWGAHMEKMKVPAGRAGSWEDVFHEIAPCDQLVVFDDDVAKVMLERRGHRAIGVVYHPAYERFGNYVPTILPRRYDAVMFIDESRAVSPLHLPEPPATEIPETFPTGM